MESSLTASSVDVPMSNDSKKRNGDSIVDYESEEEEKSQEDDDEEDEIEPTETVSILKPVTEAPVDTSKTDNLHAMKAEDVKKLMIAESAARDFIMPELPFCEVKVIGDDTIIELRNECVDFDKAEEKSSVFPYKITSNIPSKTSNPIILDHPLVVLLVSPLVGESSLIIGQCSHRRIRSTLNIFDQRINSLRNSSLNVVSSRKIPSQTPLVILNLSLNKSPLESNPSSIDIIHNR